MASIAVALPPARGQQERGHARPPTTELITGVVRTPAVEAHHERLKCWLETEVKCRLTALDEKLDRLDCRVGKCLDAVCDLNSAGRAAAATAVSDAEAARRASRCTTVPAPAPRSSAASLFVAPQRHPMRKRSRTNTNPRTTPPVPEESVQVPEAASVPHSHQRSPNELREAELPTFAAGVWGSKAPVIAAIGAAKQCTFDDSRNSMVPPLPATATPFGAQFSSAALSAAAAAAAATTAPAPMVGSKRSGGSCSSSRSSSHQSSSVGGRRFNMPPRRNSLGSLSSCQSIDSMASTRGRLREAAGRQSEFASRVWRFLEDPESSFAAQAYARVTMPLIMFSVFLTLLQTVEPAPLPVIFSAVLETTIEMFYALEVTLRYVVCPNRKAFFMNPYNVVDMVAVVPLVLRIAVGLLMPAASATEDLEIATRYVLLCAVPVLRLLKVLRHFETFQLLLSAFRQCVEALPVLLFTQLLITLVFSSLIFLVEPRDNIGSLPKAIWLTIVTMTTVGYGDVTPRSTEGSMIVAFLVISSVIFTAFPLGIIGSTFTAVWSDRDRILLMQRTRDCLDQWGYTAHDIEKLFKLADKDGDEELSLDEFRDLMDHMRLGLKDERIIELFQSFDYDFSGTINHQEFVRVLFPNVHRERLAASRENLDKGLPAMSEASSESRASLSSETTGAVDDPRGGIP